MTKPAWRLFLGLFALIAVFAVTVACGDDDDDDAGGDNTATATATSTGDGTATGTATGDTEDLDEDQTFRVNLGGAPDTLDPSSASFATELTVVQNLFRGAFRFDENLEMVPELAAEIPTEENGGISEDGLTYTIKLKDGITWSDGRAITSEDFAYGIRRAASPRTGGDYASFLWEIEGGAALGALAPDDPGIEAAEQALAIETPDEKTLVVKLAEPNAVFLLYFGNWFTFPLRQDIIDEHGDAWIQAGNLVSSGPFIMTEWVQADHITLEPNPEYHGEIPTATIRLAMIEDVNQAYNAYKAGELDQVSVPSALVPEVKADAEVSEEIVSQDRLVTFRISLVNDKAPFDNVKVRQAFAYAIDREALVEVALKGVGKPATSFIPPGLPGHDPSRGPNFDPERAKQLLEEAGFPNGEGLTAITFTFTNAGNNPPLATFLQEQWRQVLNVEVTLDPVDSQTFQDRFKNGDIQLAFVGWGADYPDAETFIAPNWVTDAGNNKAKYSNAELDALVAEAKGMPDREEALSRYEEAEAIGLEEAPDIMLFHSQSFNVRKPWIQDLPQSAMDHQVLGDKFFQFVKIRGR